MRHCRRRLGTDALGDGHLGATASRDRPRPPITLDRVLPQDPTAAPTLEYRSDRLAEAGAAPTSEASAEIDRLLRFCLETTHAS